MTRVLVLGAKGQLGSELCRWLGGAVDLVAADRQRADLAQFDVLVRLIDEVRPDVVVNAAAYTAVDRAEQEEAIAFRVNGEAPGVIAERCRRLGAALVHFSTDYVFDGAAAGAYKETDECRPLNAYGRSKRAGELAIAQVGAAHLILRVAWLYGLEGSNFVKTMLRLAADRPTLSVVADQFGAPTWVRTVAQWLHGQLAPPGKHAEPRWRSDPGIYHVAPAGRTTWYEVACTVISLAEKHPIARGSLRCRAANIRAIRSTDYPTPALRPANSQLDSTKACTLLSWSAPEWRDELVAFTRLLLDAQAGAPN
ncbi:MAG TPA: dTDP-4-dehydrorhamnose reductase [Burkholderiaceae bacterium]|nr:dTDP-4-dehydrorhamnose reductase [Burkholderiaceae bacterium]